MKLGDELAKEKPIKIKKHGRKYVFFTSSNSNFISLKYKFYPDYNANNTVFIKPLKSIPLYNI
jgi:hypothetical protein